MKLYRHYKQKYYKLHKLAKHSETLYDYAFYECLYDNGGQQFWLRPSELFFGKLEHDGKMVARFEEIELRIETITKIRDSHIRQIALIMEAVFGEWDSKRFFIKHHSKTKPCLLLAHLDDALIGFKLGYEEDQRTYYSWLGGVIPDFRRLGAASTLMRFQHDWCRQQGYQIVRTKTQNRFSSMLQLNLKFGFTVIGCHSSTDRGGIKIMLEKDLASRTF
jgi:GNAT superfamily N-acetyltransferase